MRTNALDPVRLFIRSSSAAGNAFPRRFVSFFFLTFDHHQLHPRRKLDLRSPPLSLPSFCNTRYHRLCEDVGLQRARFVWGGSSVFEGTRRRRIRWIWERRRRSRRGSTTEVSTSLFISDKDHPKSGRVEGRERWGETNEREEREADFGSSHLIFPPFSTPSSRTRTMMTPTQLAGLWGLWNQCAQITGNIVSVLLLSSSPSLQPPFLRKRVLSLLTSSPYL